MKGDILEVSAYNPKFNPHILHLKGFIADLHSFITKRVLKQNIFPSQLKYNGSRYSFSSVNSKGKD